MLSYQLFKWKQNDLTVTWGRFIVSAYENPFKGLNMMKTNDNKNAERI